MKVKPEPNSVIRRDCYWYGWGSHPSNPDLCYPREYGALCFHPNVDEFFANWNGDGVDRITPNCSICQYHQSEKEAEALEAFVGV